MNTVDRYIKTKYQTSLRIKMNALRMGVSNDTKVTDHTEMYKRTPMFFNRQGSTRSNTSSVIDNFGTLQRIFAD